MTAPRPSIFSSCSDHSLRVRCCSVMRLVLWHECHAAFTLACMGPGGSGLPGALGACALARTMDANRKIAGQTRWNKGIPFSVLSSQFSVLSSQNWMCFLFCSCYFFALVCDVDWVALLGAAKAGWSGPKFALK